MKNPGPWKCLLILLTLVVSSPVFAATTIPSQAWSRDVAASGYIDGAPIGGFGAGTITWRYDGDFYLDRLNIGSDSRNTNSNCGFYMYQKPATGSAVTRRLNVGGIGGTGQATYYALFPNAWVDYSGSNFPVKMRVRQASPIIPGDYQHVSYPCANYLWEFTNPSTQSYDVAILLTWENTFSGSSCAAVTVSGMSGIRLQRTGTPTGENQGEFTLACRPPGAADITVSSSTAVGNLTTDFNADGLLNNTVGNHTIGGLAFRVTVPAGGTATMPMALAWDIPRCQAGGGNQWYREYTRFFDRNGDNSWDIAQEALTNWASWATQIQDWQDGILNNAVYPNWLKTMLFNELYIYFTAGTYWEAGAASGQTDNASEDMFSHLECYIYDFYGTSDVRFYGSWPLVLLWPDIDKQAVRQFADSVWNNRGDRPGGLGTTAHDFGNANTVFTQWNAYDYRDSTNWKDLNSKLALMVYRDYLLTGSTDTTFLNYCWRPVTTAMAKVKSQDTDGDGLPNSSGVDQTYDDMELTGDTAYCGSLFLAACQAAKQIALARGDNTMASTYQGWFDQGLTGFNAQLWNGTYYRIDTGSFNVERIMSDQMCGQWYSKACGLGGIVSDANATSAFNTIYSNNYQRFDSGSHGVVNVMLPGGTIDTSHPQTQEAWIGTAWGVVAGMIHQGLSTQAFNVGQSLYNTIWNTAQWWFRTPEAYRAGLSQVRAEYYMRASAIWAVKRALDVMNPQCGSQTCTATRTPTITQTPTITRTPTPTATLNPCATSLFRVNCGATTITTDSLGRNWSADQAYATGSWGYVNRSGAEGYVTNDILGTTDDILYRHGSYGTSLEYRFTVTNGQYRVRLLFAEIYNFTNPGQRVFNVALEGVTVLPAYDIIASAGARYTADERVFMVNVSDDILNVVTSTAGADQPKISAIEVLDMSTMCSPTPTRTGTPPSPTPTRTNTPQPTNTRTRTSTPTNTQTSTRTSTASSTRTSTPTDTRTASPTPTSTRTNTGTPTATSTATRTYSSVPTNTRTMTRTDTPTASRTSTNTSTRTPVNTNTWTPTASSTATGTSTSTRTQTPLPTNTHTASRTSTSTASSTHTLSPTATYTGTLPPTNTRTPTLSPTATLTSTSTRTATSTSSMTPTPSPADSATLTATPSVTSTPTPTWTSTPTATMSCTATPSATLTATDSSTATASPTHTLSPTLTPTGTQSPTGTFTDTRSMTPTASTTATRTSSPTLTASLTPTNSHTPSATATWTATSSSTATASMTATPSLTASFSPTTPASLTWTFTSTNTDTPTWTPTETATSTHTRTNIPTSTDSMTSTATASRTATNSVTATRTPTNTNTPTASDTATSSETPTPSETPSDTSTSSPTNTTSPTCVPDVVTPIPYPNPCREDCDEVRIPVAVRKDGEKVTVQVFTTAYRKIIERDYRGLPSGLPSVKLPMRDAKNKPLANGLYYVVVKTQRGRAIGKLIVLK